MISVEGNDLSEANLKRTNLEGVNLKSINFKGADPGAFIHRSLYDKNTHWPERFDYRNSGAIYLDVESNLCVFSLRGLNFIVIKLRFSKRIKTDLCDTALVDAALSCSDHIGVNLGDADLQRVNLRNAKLCNPCLLCTMIYHVDLSGSDLMGTSLRSTNLCGCNLKYQIRLASAFLASPS